MIDLSETGLAQLKSTLINSAIIPQATKDSVLILINEIERLRQCIWPGLESWPWKPTQEQPKQDFYEAMCESNHRTNKLVLEILQKVSEYENGPLDTTK